MCLPSEVCAASSRHIDKSQVNIWPGSCTVIVSLYQDYGMYNWKQHKLIKYMYNDGTQAILHNQWVPFDSHLQKYWSSVLLGFDNTKQTSILRLLFHALNTHDDCCTCSGFYLKCDAAPCVEKVPSSSAFHTQGVSMIIWMEMLQITTQYWKKMLGVWVRIQPVQWCIAPWQCINSFWYAVIIIHNARPIPIFLVAAWLGNPFRSACPNCSF